MRGAEVEKGRLLQFLIGDMVSEHHYPGISGNWKIKTKMPWVSGKPGGHPSPLHLIRKSPPTSSPSSPSSLPLTSSIATSSEALYLDSMDDNFSNLNLDLTGVADGDLPLDFPFELVAPTEKLPDGRPWFYHGLLLADKRGVFFDK